jgi:type II secretion system protein G
VIILLLAGALVVFVLPQQEGAEKNTTKLLLNQVSSALDTYRLNLGHYPSEQEGGLDALLKKPTFENERAGEKWQGPYLKPGTKLDDPWGHSIRYELVDRSTSDGEKKGAIPTNCFLSVPTANLIPTTISNISRRRRNGVVDGEKMNLNFGSSNHHSNGVAPSGTGV